MHERPVRLSVSATRILKASRVLSWSTKAVWLEDWVLDRGPEGAWISAANLGERLGLSRESVERHRRVLRDAGLYFIVRRHGARSDGWIPQLPAECIPSERPSVSEVALCRERLDRLLGGVSSDATIVELCGVNDVTAAASDSTPQATALGGRGESLLRSPGRETTLQPQEAGEVAYATEGQKRQDGGGPERISGPLARVIDRARPRGRRVAP